MPPSLNPYEESGLGVGGKSKFESLSFVDGAALVLPTPSASIGVVRCHESQTCGRSDNNMQAQHGKTDHKHSISGHASKAREMQEVIFGSALWEMVFLWQVLL